MKYNKLVRDKIPELPALKDKVVRYHTAGSSEYALKLKEKLLEEVAEYCQDESSAELADIYEVISAIIDYKQFDRAEIESIRLEKLNERGGFEKQIVLEEIEG